MKLWQKIFLPSVVLTMIGIFLISTSLMLRSHTLQLEAQKQAVISKSKEVISELQQSIEFRKKGHFLSSSAIKDILLEVSQEFSTEDITVLLKVHEDENQEYTTKFEFLEENNENHCIRFQTATFILGICYEIHIFKDIQQFLQQVEEDIQVIQIYGMVVSLTISLVLLFLSVLITKPIQSLKKATEILSVGDYSYRITYKGKDELSELAQYMNDMASHIETDTAYIANISESRRIFIANMTHELKTPLTSILGFADVLRIKSNLSEEEKRNYAEIIFTEAKRLRSLSSRLMELLTIHEIELHMTSVQIKDLILREIEMYHPICEESEILLKTDLEQAVVFADETLLATMLVNLLDNARKASDAGKEIQVCCKKKAEHILIQVKDKGMGIPKEEIAYVTEAFYMVDKARTRKSGGAGIGLALCKAIVTAHHGELIIESELGIGTIVSVLLPNHVSHEVDS